MAKRKKQEQVYINICRILSHLYRPENLGWGNLPHPYLEVSKIEGWELMLKTQCQWWGLISLSIPHHKPLPYIELENPEEIAQFIMLGLNLAQTPQQKIPLRVAAELLLRHTGRKLSSGKYCLRNVCDFT